MLTPQSYNLPPINPEAFGGLPQEGAPPQAGGPQGATQGEPVMDMNQYLIDKVMEIKQRMGAGGAGVGALGAMMQQQQPQPRPQPQPQQPQQQQVEMV